MYNVADYIAEFLAEIKCTTVHGLMGGGAAGLNDGFIRHKKINYKCYHHEQSAGYSALGEARYTKRWAVVNPTTGCGGANCFTPVMNAWQDSIPLVVISGNVNLSSCTSFYREDYGVDLRSYGVQEHDIIKSVNPITKYAAVVTNADDIDKILFDAFFEAANGRKSPCWIDVPADIQHQSVSEKKMLGIQTLIMELYSKLAKLDVATSSTGIESETLDLLSSCTRPLVLVGGGVSNDITNKQLVRKFITDNGLSVVATYGATDVIDHGNDLYLGAVGIKGIVQQILQFKIVTCL